MLTVTADVSANLKTLRILETKNLVEIYAVNIENHQVSSKIRHKEFPIMVFDSPFGLIDQCVIAADDTSYFRLLEVFGNQQQHHADILHLERHIESKRDIFATEDNDFLSRRSQLEAEFGIKIMTPSELVVELLP